MARLLLVLLVNGSEFHKTGAAQCTGLKFITVDNFRKTTVVVLKEQSNFTLLQKYILALVYLAKQTMTSPAIGPVAASFSKSFFRTSSRFFSAPAKV